MMRRGRVGALAGVLCAAMLTSAALAAPACQNTGNFERWLDGFRKEAAEAGITRQTISAALGGMTMDPGIIARDRRQSFFAQSFLDFSDKLAKRFRVDNGQQKIRQHKALFDKVEK